MPVNDLSLFLPEMVLCSTALAVLLLDLWLPRARRGVLPALAVAGLALFGCCAAGLWDPQRGPAYDFWGSYVIDNFGVFLKVLFAVVGVLIVLLSTDFFRDIPAYGEYWSLLLFVLLGMTLLASANDLITIYLAFELVSLVSYVLAGYLRRDPKSNEAALKYFLYGASASGVMIYGMSLLYGLGGSTNLQVLADRLATGQATPLGALALMLVLAGLGYKVAMAPFQAWCPDVYEGAPTPVTAFLSVGPKVAGFAILLRFAGSVMPSLVPQWQVVVAVLATLTMFVGNLLAIRQQNLKRLLAYSSIAHAGYLLIGVVAAGSQAGWGLPAVLFYLAAYVLMNLGVFALLLIVARSRGTEELSGFSGLAQGAPAVAAAMVVFLLSLTGIPPTAGFVGKLYLFAAAIRSGTWWWLAFVGIINSAISLYYYMNIVRLMYFGQPTPELGPRSPRLSGVVWVCLLGTLALGLMPQPLLQLARQAGSLLVGR
jgi:NADH-quinone oxidoreductase subunit N